MTDIKGAIFKYKREKCSGFNYFKNSLHDRCIPNIVLYIVSIHFVLYCMTFMIKIDWCYPKENGFPFAF